MRGTRSHPATTAAVLPPSWNGETSDTGTATPPWQTPAQLTKTICDHHQLTTCRLQLGGAPVGLHPRQFSWRRLPNFHVDLYQTPSAKAPLAIKDIRALQPGVT
ncbi:hypothetical protein F443_06924 [Phytophthora nicotianae P1569]|uniref:Uncharacterized protein n=1 Tax=Phytophthora nicotianae P1569 TaxID=1317065 RepID=V9FCH5_PHYNI|nr:hypothetical protein F443_06924 [Phytophthora nicotianae P1569]